MSRIEDLITELCPDGVEWKELGEVSHYSKDRIGSGVLNSNNYVGVDNLLAEKKGKTVSSYVPIDGQLTKFHKGNILIGNIRPYLKKIWLATHEGGTNGDVLVICIKNQKIISPEYLYYVLSSDQFFSYNMQNSKGAKMPRGDKGSIMRYSIPIPPLPIQEEIVRILDVFTTLEARKKQYEYYRDELLSFGDDVEWKTLGSIALNLDSKRKPVTKGSRDAGKYPYYGASGIVDYVSNYIFNGDFLLVSEDGANLVARVTPIAFSASGKIWVNNHAHILKFNTYNERKYVEYYLNMIDLSSFISTAAQPKLTQDNLNKIRIPIPPLAEQARIVEILDRFDALTNDITVGLPAEIAARRKQYEYYRDKLLSFKEKVS